ncbi:MAG: YheT family hydrolase [Acidobacteriota bacterium]
MPPFRPAPLLQGAGLQTVTARFIRVPSPARSLPSERIEVEVEPGERILLARTRSRGRPRGRLILLHGLAGCADSPQLRFTLAAAHTRGWEVLRVNARRSGDGMRLSRHLPHAGRWSDLGAVLAKPVWTPEAAGRPLVAVGFSLGGAVLLRYLAETGPACPVDAAVAVNPPTDLAWCLRELERPGNFLYHLYFTCALCRAMRRRSHLYPRDYRPPGRWRHRSVRALDTDYVAPDAGFTSAEAYYAACSAGPLLGGIQVPSLVLSSQDDPFIPWQMLRRDIPAGRAVKLRLLPRGGHVGYVERSGLWLSFWAARAVLDAAQELLHGPVGDSPSIW